MANGIRNLIGRLTTGDPHRVSEMIGRYVISTAQTTLYRFRSYLKTADSTVPDYEFYDKLRRAKAKGYTISGLFCRAIETKFSTWVFGDGLTVSLRDDEAGEVATEYTNTRLSEFIGGLLDAGLDYDETRLDYDDETRSLVMAVYEDAMGLGDQYIVVNTDGTLSVPSPDTVTIERDEFDYHRVLAVEITTKSLDGSHTVIDRYEPTMRTVTTKKGAQAISVERYQNLIGRIPVVHIAHGRSGNETNGHSIHEDLLTLLSEYDDVAFKQLDGAKLLGNPIPVFEGLEDINATIEANDPAEYDTYTDKDGNTATHTQIDLDQNSIFFLGKGGSAKMLAPPTGFTTDTSAALRTLFLMLLARTGIPEFIWGGELTSARATSETQLKQWVKDIQARQRDAGGWIIKLCTLWLQIQVLTDPQLVVAPLDIEWPDLVPEDASITLQRLTFALDNSLIRRVTALELLHLVDDPQVEAELAQGEADERREEMFPGQDGFFGGLNGQDEDEDDNE